MKLKPNLGPKRAYLIALRASVLAVQLEAAKPSDLSQAAVIEGGYEANEANLEIVQRALEFIGRRVDEWQQEFAEAQGAKQR